MVFDVSVTACSVPATDAWSWADPALADVDAAAAAASAVAASTAVFAASGLPAPAGCGARPFGAVSVVDSVASVDEVVLEVGFAATGAVAATVLVKAAAFKAVASAGGAGWFVGVTTVWVAAVTAVFAVAVAVGVGVAAAAMVAAAAVGSVLTGADDAACAETACELAAIAAAAIASGAVAPLGVGVAAATWVTGVETGITTATGVGVTESAACWARRVGSTAEVSSVVDFAVDFVVPVFGALELAVGCWPAPVLAALLVLAVLVLAVLALPLLPLASDGGPELSLLLLLLFGSLLAG